MYPGRSTSTYIHLTWVFHTLTFRGVPVKSHPVWMHLQLHVQPVFPIWWLFLRQIPGSLAIPEVHAEEWYKWLRHQKWDLVQNLARYLTHQKWDLTCTLRTEIFHFLHCLCSVWCPCVCNYLQKWKFSGSGAHPACVSMIDFYPATKELSSAYF